MRVVQQPKTYIDKFPPLRMTPAEFLALPEYSATNPTGATPGKMWRRLDGCHDFSFIQAGGKPYWMICQYDPECPPDATTIKILRFKPVISVK